MTHNKHIERMQMKPRDEAEKKEEYSSEIEKPHPFQTSLPLGNVMISEKARRR